MAEIKTLIDGKSLSYEGVFNLKELYRVIDKWFKDHGYDKQEIKNWEDVTENEKQIVLEIIPYKKVSDYARIDIRIFMIFSKLTEIELEKDKIKHKMNKGRAEFYFDAYVVTDYEHKWETKAVFYFIKNVFDKVFIAKDMSMLYLIAAGIPALFLVKGQDSDSVDTFPLIRSLIYDKAAISVKSEAWVPWTKGIY